MFEILELSKESSNSIWDKSYKYFKENKTEFDNYSDFNEYKEGILRFIQNSKDNFAYLIIEKDVIIGTFITYIENYNEKKLAINTGIKKNKINDNIQKSIIKKACSNYQDVASVLFYTNKENQNYFLSNSTFKKIKEVDICLLKKDDLDLINMVKVGKKIENKNPNLTLVPFDIIPENKLRDYVSLYLDITNDIPNNEPIKLYDSDTAEGFVNRESNFKKDGNKLLRFAIFNEFNDIVAFSLFRIYKENQKYPYQGMTGVKKEYRGKGLTIWLKSIMFQKLFKEYQYTNGITCSMLSNNKYIQNINKSLGFHRISTQTTYLLNKKSIDNIRTNDVEITK